MDAIFNGVVNNVGGHCTARPTAFATETENASTVARRPGRSQQRRSLAEPERRVAEK